MSNENEDRGRTAGVTFGPLKRALREHAYPVSVAELIEQYGGFELETGSGGERLETTLERCERTRFHEPREVRDAILDALGEEPRGEAPTAGERGEESEADGADDWSQLST
ncbi:hypothetical protein DJ82_11735 [Halorubrum sp. Ib24]|uniref:DUF5789 family protein n=1 Tax=unclassified Halorubrum TaxID=2642239 RepID=UPI000B999398|nr:MULTISPECIES: hypothetical protein [unclassified Halorubrum]OYR38566.1 hypothetical protein DJ82_11735 [Halorubrum sp. Ib24]OYR44557.1 hypothetical protein DJ81_07020 [Halorubrum sp. Hd13]OYR48577.1 hypothetical protein DJ75_02540 [Halorubrum sp. Eb13]OYR56180.1 hypothetical protein DJ73_00285 [Halorubrum sp. Ea1]